MECGRSWVRTSLFCVPTQHAALLVIVLLAGYPIVYSAWISLHKYGPKRPRIFDFVGLANYQHILQSEEFWSALWITLAFTGRFSTCAATKPVVTSQAKSSK
jgi:ABC-type sugar transport system permease subunit